MSKTVTALEWTIPAVLAAWFSVSVLGQHPDGSYGRVRELDNAVGGMVIPNWKFFAPEPGVDDTHFLYRLASEDQSVHTDWCDVFSFAPRRFSHAFWFPGRRVEKALFDVSASLLHNPLEMTPLLEDAKRSAVQLVNEFVRRRITPVPGYPLFQVLMVRYSGFDESEDPQYDMVFDYERVNR